MLLCQLQNAAATLGCLAYLLHTLLPLCIRQAFKLVRDNMYVHVVLAGCRRLRTARLLMLLLLNLNSAVHL